MSKKNKAGDFIVQKITLPGGLEISSKLTLGALMYLEDKIGQPIGKMKLDAADMKMTYYLITGLAISANPDMAQEEVEKKVKAVSIDSLNAVLRDLPDTFEGPEKNPRSKVRGNLQE